jgi:hypothetical protein
MTHHLSRAPLALLLACAFTPPTFAADLPPTLTGTLINPAGDTLTFGTPSTTATLILNNHSAVINDGTWNAYAGTLSPNYSSPGPTLDYAITNTGTLTIDANTGTFALLDFTTNQPSSRSPEPRLVTFTNTGTINLNTGKFYLTASDSGSTSGTINLAANTTLGLAGNLTFDANSILTGSGNVLLSTAVRNSANGTSTPNLTNTHPAIAFNGTYNVTGTTNIEGTSVTFNHDVTLHDLQTTDANISGAGTITLTGSGTFAGPSSVSWTGGPAWNGGTISSSILLNGTLQIGRGPQTSSILNGGAITVLPGAALSLAATTLYLSNHASITNNGFLYLRGATFSQIHFTPNDLLPPGAITNNGTIEVGGSTGMSHAIQFNNNGTINVRQGFFQLAPGTDSSTAVVNVQKAAELYVDSRPMLAGTLNNAGNVSVRISSPDKGLLGTGLSFINQGTLTVSDGTLTLAAPQNRLTTGIFLVAESSILEFAADYDFSSLTGPSLDRYSDGDGLLLIDPGITLTLPLDTAFAGTIQVDGTLIIAPPLDPANINMTPNFTVLPTQIPEPATLSLLALALPLLRKRHPR